MTRAGTRTGMMRRLLQHVITPVGRALMVYGGIDMYVERDSYQSQYRSLDDECSLLLPGQGGPPPGHPERLRPDVPLSRQELQLLRELLGAAGAEQLHAEPGTGEGFTGRGAR